MNTAELQALKLRPNSGAAFARIDLAPLSDTGNAVPIGIALKAPTGVTLQSFEIFAPDNPISRVIQITLGAPQQEFRFETRFRLGISQDVWLVAILSDGTLMGDHAPTVLTSSACFDAS